MKTPLILCAVSLAGIIAALTVPSMSDLILVFGPAALGSLWLLIKAVLRLRGPRARAGSKWIVIDGSNVMYWDTGSPSIDPVCDVVAHLKDRGFKPLVFFDANAGYLVQGRYQHDKDLGKLIGLPENRVTVVDKGTQADEKILTAARNVSAAIVTNDRYRDWAERFPEVTRPGALVAGGYRKGDLWLDLELVAPPPQEI